jgi:hypothetical protein
MHNTYYQVEIHMNNALTTKIAEIPGSTGQRELLLLLPCPAKLDNICIHCGNSILNVEFDHYVEEGMNLLVFINHHH